MIGEGRVTASEVLEGACHQSGTSTARAVLDVVDIWVHQGSGGAAKMEAFDWNSKLIKRYPGHQGAGSGQSHHAEGD
jgi:hypothetical protein